MNFIDLSFPLHFFQSSRYLLEEKSDDSILLILVIRIMDALGNHGNGHCIWMNYIYWNFLAMKSIISLLSASNSCLTFFFFFPSFYIICVTGRCWYDAWSGEAWNLESAAIKEPPINFIVSSNYKGKRRWIIQPFGQLVTWTMHLFLS